MWKWVASQLMPEHILYSAYKKPWRVRKLDKKEENAIPSNKQSVTKSWLLIGSRLDVVTAQNSHFETFWKIWCLSSPSCNFHLGLILQYYRLTDDISKQTKGRRLIHSLQHHCAGHWHTERLIKIRNFRNYAMWESKVKYKRRQQHREEL